MWVDSIQSVEGWVEQKAEEGEIHLFRPALPLGWDISSFAGLGFTP